MLIRMKKTGAIVNEASGFARMLIEKGSAEPVEKQAETAALKTGGREETRGKKAGARRI
jgi:hypothetical protein